MLSSERSLRAVLIDRRRANSYRMVAKGGERALYRVCRAIIRGEDDETVRNGKPCTERRREASGLAADDFDLARARIVETHHLRLKPPALHNPYGLIAHTAPFAPGASK